MKAVIMAGGEGTRLRPLSLGLPKPMTPLFDKPVMEHIIALLRRSGIVEIAVTLQYMPGVVMDYFGDGREQGVSLTYFVEHTPLGTAGSVKNCMDWVGEEDFLVISGDAVCGLDLKAAMGFHAVHRSAATLVLCRHPAPLEYGLVLTGEEGRVERFIEKPGWGQVLTNQINTGIYLLSRRAMDRVPEGQPYDFGRELFPALLEEGEALYGCTVEGYWCDMGDCRSYLNCVADALAGQVPLDFGVPERSPGVWSADELPGGAQIIPPCYLGRNVTVEEGALIGPNTALGEGSTVGRDAMVQRSVLHGAHAGNRSTLYGALLCQGAFTGTGAVLNEGAVLGARASAGEDAILMENVKVWPGREAPAGSRLTASLTTGGLREPLRFGSNGVIHGKVGEEITPELLLLLGGSLGAEGKLGLGWSGGEGARMLIQAAASGAAAAGGQAFLNDAPCPAAAAWLGRCYSLPASLFAAQEGEQIFLHFSDRRGLPLGRARERKLEGAVLRGEQTRVPAGRIGHLEQLSGTGPAYAADAARRTRLSRLPLRPMRVAAPGRTPADQLLRESLERLGCAVQGAWERGIPAFRAGHGGFSLTAMDETGGFLPPERLLAMLLLIEYQDGGGTAAVPAAAPATLDLLAERYGGNLLRVERDGPEAEEHYEALPWLRDAAFAACRLCARLGQTGETLEELERKTPRFHILTKEIPLLSSRGDVMQALRKTGLRAQPVGEGIRIPSGGGWAYLTPLARRSALRVTGEGPEMEIAAELCDFYSGKVRELDKKTVEEHQGEKKREN